MRRLEDNIKIDLKEIGIDTRNWVESALGWDYWRALVNAPGSVSHGVRFTKKSELNLNLVVLFMFMN